MNPELTEIKPTVEAGGRLQLLPKRASQRFGVALVGTVILLSILAPVIVPFDPAAQDLAGRLKPPHLTSGHILGSDALGRDILSRVLYGGRVSLAVSGIATLLAALLGVALGLVAGYSHRLGIIVLGLADAQLAFPVLLLAIVFAATVGPTLPNVIIILVLSGWVTFARPVHAVTLSIQRRDFVLAARSIGGSDRHILLTHLLPHVLPIAVVLAVLQIGRAMLLESTLSFLGLGVPVEVPTWGSILNDAAPYTQIAPWVSVVPGVAIVVAVLGFSLAGDWLRDVVEHAS